LVWRSLDELASTEKFDQSLHREFAPGASEWNDDDVSRRNFLKIMGASVAMAGAAGCMKYPYEAIVPYVQPPEELVPGEPLFFATAMPWDGHAWPLLVESHEGRPTKIEGNPDHPASLGSTTAIAQASVLQMYDPDRSQNVMFAAQISTWAAFGQAIAREMEKLRGQQGAGLRFLTPTVTSPTLAQQLRDLIKANPKAQWHQYEPVANHAARRASVQAFGRAVNTVYDFSAAKRIVSLDSDFLTDEPGMLRYARQFINGRRLRKSAGEHGATHPGQPSGEHAAAAGGTVTREILGSNWNTPEKVEPVTDGKEAMNRLYVVESNYTSTGAMADHRMALKPSQVEDFARALAAALGAPGVQAPGGIDAKFVDAVAQDLKQNAGASIVIAGRSQTPAVHALAHAINQALGNVGKTVAYTDATDAEPVDQIESITQLCRDMAAGQVDTLVILGGNPAYDAPADLNFAGLLQNNVRLRIHHSLYFDETSFYCHWHLPASHYLEAWSDARAFDGTASIVQPLVQPLYRTKSVHEVVDAFVTAGGAVERTGYDLVKAYWADQAQGDGEFDKTWQTYLHRGLIEGSAFAPVQVKFNAQALAAAATEKPAGNIEIQLRPDPSIWDGSFANNAWLQELPKPITKLTWDNAALMSKKTADALGVESEGLVEIPMSGGRALTVPVWIVPGHADDAITLHLGFGRTRAGQVGGNESQGTKGVDAYVLRNSNALSILAANVTAKKGRYPLASTQLHQDPEGRDLIRVESGDRFATNEAHFPHQHGFVPGLVDGVVDDNGRKTLRLSLYPEYDYDTQHRWGMAIDNNACIGCNACVVACQSENNIPTVGKEQVSRYREMHWLRIDTYHLGEAEAPVTVFEPMLCQHCEHAPCEVVCPVNATTHSAEGINEMTYNRCVGTRYCSNNCPYKVRRFNFLSWTDHYSETLAMQRNPHVTVRNRGVMEKCTYCVQRVNATRIDLKKLRVQADTSTDPAQKQDLANQAHEAMLDLQTACQQACPTEAIVFGDLNYRRPDPHDPKKTLPSRVTELKAQQQSFGVLTELNTQPRTTYMARFRNPNPALEPDPVHYPLAHEPQEAHT
jgi:molybdopterin-containing oxidoreductase family iron-sulfur binding subunit